jgi:hypothetical protein
MMEPTLLDEIQLPIDLAQLWRQFRIREESRTAAEIRDLVEEARAVGRPKALYRACLIEGRGEDFVSADGERFRSRVLAVNVQRTQRLFPFVATCGRELEEWSGRFDSGLKKFCAESIKGMALAVAMGALLDHIRDHHHPEKVAMMNPGSLEDWPLAEQQGLFRLLGNPAEAIGVELTENLLMKPGMSASGLWFASGEDYENCMLCPMPDCPGRRAPYDEGLYERKYRKG